MDPTFLSRLLDPSRPNSPPPTTPPKHRPPSFPSYKDAPNLPPKTKLLCQLLATTPPPSLPSALDQFSQPITQNDVEQILKLSYSYPSAAVLFFRWAGYQLAHNNSPYSWNLVVDLLGKNFYFGPMWDAIKSMRLQGLVSLATFASVFSSYVIAGNVKDAILTFEVMDRYDCARDVVALNSLVSAICRDGKTSDASDFVRMVKFMIRPDGDTYAILLEGWAKESDLVNARQTFAEMVVEVGWDRDNLFAYDAYLCTVLSGQDGLIEAVKLLRTMIMERGCHPNLKFFGLALEECEKCGDVKSAEMVWEALVGLESVRVRPDHSMYLMMISLCCNAGNAVLAMEVFREMVSVGGFPDEKMCNLLFLFLIKGGKLNEAMDVFNELSKRGCVPNHANCAAAVRLCVDANNAYLAAKVWKSMIAVYDTDLDETGNLLLVGLCDFRMVDEAVKHAEEMIRKGIRLTTFSKLKQTLTLERKEFLYDALVALWNSHQSS